MKNIQFILIFTFVTLVACKKEDPNPIEPTTPPIYVPIFEPGDTSKGAAYANKLTAFWKANTYCKRSIFDSTKLSIEFFTYTANGNRRESLGFSYFSKKNTGAYNFTTATTGINNLPLGETFTSYATWISDGDALDDYYRSDSTDLENRLVITKIDLANKRVEGTFHASYNIQEPRSNPLNPKKVTFSEGRFWATIRD